MYDMNLYNNVLSQYVKEVALKTNATSIYLVGSFSTNNMWTLGMSDIDLKVISFGESNHGCIDITDKVMEFYKNNDSKQLIKRATNNKEEVMLSYTVWNIDDIQDEYSWKKFYVNEDWYNSMIITDQLIFMGSKELLYGEEVELATVAPHNFRDYLNSLSSKFCEIKPGFSILNEIKIIIYAIRLYFYLWSGRYIYDYDDLLKTIQDVLFDDVIISSLKKAVDIRRKMDSGEINTNVNSKDYFSLTKCIIKERKMIIDYLGAKDKVYCKKNQEQWIGEVSVLAQGVIV